MTLPPLFLGAPTGTNPPAAQAARRDADAEPLSLPELPEDLRDQILGYAVDYSKEFERAKNLPEDRVGVPYPRGHALHGKHKEDFKILEIGVCGVFPDVCRQYLVTALLTNEQEYWASKSRDDPDGVFVNVLNAFRARKGERATLFDAVLDAIDRRDGVRVVTLPEVTMPKGGKLKERLALQYIDEETLLPWTNATATVLRARHWFQEYAEQHADGANSFGKRLPTGKPVSAHNVPLPMGHQNGLRAATQIVALAQALVRLRDAGREDLAHFLQTTAEYPTYNPGALRRVRIFANAPVAIVYYDTLAANGPGTVEECINEAEEVILRYGPPDAWNTSGVSALMSAFEAHTLVDTTEEDAVLRYRIMNRWRGRGFQPSTAPPPVAEYKKSVDAIVEVLGTRAIQLRWPVGLYDTSDATNLTYCFVACDTFDGHLHGWNTANVANMYGCFAGCKTFNRPLQSWDVGKCENFTFAFKNCAAFNQPLDDWNVKQASAVWMRGIFAGCAAFAQPLDKWYDQLKNRFAIVEMFAEATAWLQRAREQQAGGQFFSRLAPHVNVATGTLSAIKDPDPSTGGESSR